MTGLRGTAATNKFQDHATRFGVPGFRGETRVGFCRSLAIRELMMKSRLLCFFLLVFSIGLPAALFAQDTATITGTVTDSSGAAMANAQVTVISTEHGITRTTATNGSGDYLFAALPIGSYNLSVSETGFKKYEAQGVILRVAEKTRVNVVLQVGAVNTEVIVQGQEVAQVETQSSDLGGTVTGKEITQLELNGRNFTQLITLVPGVSNQTGQDEAGVGVSGNVSFSVNGGRTEYNNWEMDGGDAMDNGSNTTLNVYPSVDAIAEFKVLTSNYGAQYGRNGSGTVEVETKSGTSHFHGDLYEFVRNDFFNATPEFQTAPPAYKKNDFGFTIGGPVFIPGHYNTSKQKTFFFWSEEWRRDIVPATSFFSVTTVPTVAERTGNFSDVCPAPGSGVDTTNFPNCPVNPQSGAYFPGNQIPISNPTVVNGLLPLIPMPNDGPSSWFATPSLPTKWREELFRVDQNISDKVRATFRYIHDSWDQDYPVPLWTNGVTFPTIQTNFNGPGVSMVARVTASASPTLLNEFVASYTTDHITTSLIGPWQRPANFPAIGIYDNGFGGKVPGIMLTGGQYNFAEDPGYVPNGPLNSNPTFTFRDNVTKIIGAHNLQFGIYTVMAHKKEIPQPQYGVNGQLQFSTSSSVTTGNAFADLLLGNIGTYTQAQAALKMHEQYNIFEPFIQDDWHATSRLTLNVGLRMSFFGTYSEKNNLAWNFDPAHYVPGASSIDPTTGLVIGNPYNGWVDCGITPGVPAGCMTNHWWNPAPRLGFAYDPLGNGKWAIRGGYGIFFEHTNGNEANTESLEPYNINTQTSSVVNIAGYGNLNPSALAGGTPPLSFVSIPSKATWPYMQQWHLDVQHDLGKNTVATLSYVGSAGVHLTRSYEYNQMHAVPASQNPYAPGQPINTSFDCSWGPGNAQPNVVVDAYGVPTNAVTSFGTPVPYNPPGANGLPSGAAVNLFVACGNNATPFLPYAGIGSITRKDQTGSSNYNALQTSLRHSIGGLQLNAAYTYSHSIDDSSDYNDSGFVDSYNLNAYRASSNFDERHIINIGYVYDLPFLKGKSLADRFLGGWQWSGITDIESGTPFSVYNEGGGNIPNDNAGVSNTFATAASYPDVVGNPSAGIPALPPGNPPLLYNPAVFVAPTGLTFGNAGRNILRNPWRTNFDMALLKHFAVTESKYFEFRAEAFNVFNHREYSWLGGDAGSAADNANGTGVTTANAIGCYGGANNSAGDPSCLGNGLLQPNSAHNPRILQLALKFIF
jgi:hypothetical protein